MGSNKKARTKNGFTIVEVIVVIVVFGIGIITLGSLVSSIQYAQRSAQYLEISTQAARAQVELIRNSQFTTITDGATFTPPAGLPGGSTGRVKVTTPSAAPSSKQIDVTVSYPLGSLTKDVTISAYVDPPETP